jgi:hypothetical protein
MLNILPANRLAAIATWLTGLAAFIGSVEGTLPGKWQDTALGIAGLLTSLAAAVHFMTGSQKYDQLVHGAAADLAGPDADPAEADAEIARALAGPAPRVASKPDSAVTPDPEPATPAAEG